MTLTATKWVSMGSGAVLTFTANVNIFLATKWVSMDSGAVLNFTTNADIFLATTWVSMSRGAVLNFTANLMHVFLSASASAGQCFCFRHIQ